MSAFFRFNGHDFLILGKSKEKAMLSHFFSRAGFVLERGHETCKKKCSINRSKTKEDLL